MSRIKTYSVSKDDLTELMTALNLTREDIPRICTDVSSGAYGWWLYSGEVPVKHLLSLKGELERQLKFREPTEIDRRASKKLKTIFAILGIDTVYAIEYSEVERLRARIEKLRATLEMYSSGKAFVYNRHIRGEVHFDSTVSSDMAKKALYEDNAAAKGET